MVDVHNHGNVPLFAERITDTFSDIKSHAMQYLVPLHLFPGITLVDRASNCFALPPSMAYQSRKRVELSQYLLRHSSGGESPLGLTMAGPRQTTKVERYIRITKLTTYPESHTFTIPIPVNSPFLSDKIISLSRLTASPSVAQRISTISQFCCRI